MLQIPTISKNQAGAYLCIASVSFTKRLLETFIDSCLLSTLHVPPFQNGIPPSVSKRITVVVNCKTNNKYKLNLQLISCFSQTEVVYSAARLSRIDRTESDTWVLDRVVSKFRWLWLLPFPYSSRLWSRVFSQLLDARPRRLHKQRIRSRRGLRNDDWRGRHFQSLHEAVGETAKAVWFRNLQVI